MNRKCERHRISCRNRTRIVFSFRAFDCARRTKRTTAATANEQMIFVYSKLTDLPKQMSHFERKASGNACNEDCQSDARFVYHQQDSHVDGSSFQLNFTFLKKKH